MKPLCLVMSLVLPFLAAARPPVPVADDPALSAIGAFLALSVADIDASARCIGKARAEGDDANIEDEWRPSNRPGRRRVGRGAVIVRDNAGNLIQFFGK